VYEGELTWLRPVERFFYRIAGVDPDEDQHWTAYAAGMLLFSVVSMLLTYLVLRLQAVLPLNPDGLAAVTDRQSFETAASFTTNTNWQSYAGESTMSHLSQMTQLAFHNFVSAAVGMGVAVAFIRALSRKSAGRIGNFWADLVRGTLYLFLPVSFIASLVLVQQGAIQNFSPSVEVTTLEGATQTARDGPGGEPGVDQAARHQRRRLLQRQRRASVREPDAVHEPAVDAPDLRDPVGAGLRVRSRDRERPACLDGLGRDGGDLRRWRRHHLWAEARGNPIHAAAGVSLATTATHRAATWKARKSASASRTPRSTR
jgi:hypothetical protein